MRKVVLRSPPGEPDDDEIIMRALLLNAVEVVPQLAVRQKKAQPFALVAAAILIQYMFDVHNDLLEPP